MIRRPDARFPPRVLYVVYWGAAEPLGRSLVQPAVKQLARMGVDLTLVTFEKPVDWNRLPERDAIRASLEAEGVRWLPLRYHKRPKLPATLFDVAHGAARGLLVRDRGRFDVVHARTFVGGLIGLALAPALGAKLVYHNEGFYPDEQVDGGVWERGSLAHRTARWLERRLYARAEGVIAVSDRGREDIERILPVPGRSARVVVVPSGVDLERFRPTAVPPGRRPGLRFVYVGSVGARYMLDAIARFVAVSSRELGPVELRVLTREPADRVRHVLLARGLAPASFSIDFVSHEKIPYELARHDVGLFFLTRGLSEHGCSPTKIGEYWACGLPVVSTANVGDTDAIIRRDRVGVIIGEHSEEGYRGAARELVSLLADPELARRCRRAAEQHYDFSVGCDRQLELYRRILPPAGGSMEKTCAA